eukprot:9450744-Pyramimonas_sp.AAC.1
MGARTESDWDQKVSEASGGFTAVRCLKRAVGLPLELKRKRWVYRWELEGQERWVYRWEWGEWGQGVGKGAVVLPLGSSGWLTARQQEGREV